VVASSSDRAANDRSTAVQQARQLRLLSKRSDAPFGVTNLLFPGGFVEPEVVGGLSDKRL
jgi:hypothetical protein